MVTKVDVGLPPRAKEPHFDQVAIGGYFIHKDKLFIKTGYIGGRNVADPSKFVKFSPSEPIGLVGRVTITAHNR